MNTSLIPGQRQSPDAITVRGLNKTYGLPKGGTLTAVDQLDLTIHAGETYALLGPNGAGKSTAIEILEGHRKPDSGEVMVLGTRPWKAAPSFRARIGIVLQESTDSGELRVSEALRSLAACFPAPRPVDEVMEAVGLGGKGGVRISTLSGGQRRRLDVALGIIGNPEVLFLDEPTTGFDPEARRQFWDLIRRLSSGGTTIVLTTHYLDEAEQLADRIGVINHGRLIAEGSPQDIGGPGLRMPRVRWRDASGLREVVTEQPASLVASLSDGGAIEPAELAVVRPSLEDIYLQLIGAADGAEPSAEPSAARSTDASSVSGALR
ncbi:ABC transporter ATP-binding protein [Pseudarthrobacter cellobiosi]|uniref:ABC transporter ATP-binding protein n=1 Tax=Pseudarthrobacter cellobiosi TaxID=2953654 RepID=UPI00208E833E|nr:MULTISPECIES: ABC transporter ATP-binding protein [unclassified Pseudarthrobacter]MCO4256835.1 ABC transporter ATP-binding protein [Pseudarthrobacter sp. HLT1-5]MCO4276345.1 ABC transporter ATP-binding protein [Pseudarthrobacter sp. HLT3-5]